MAVAYSGGRDSTALLHATWRAAKPLGLRVVALHVHHGLSQHADAWLAHCERQCANWIAEGASLDLLHRRVSVVQRRGASVEAQARQARYEALTDMARSCGAMLVLLAHHRQDQAETFLLQALRGAGVVGLAGMPREIVREGICWARPWLDRPRSAIEGYVREHGLSFVDDDSNADARFARNRLRLKVWPELVHAFEQAEATLADAATWAADAAAVLQEVAEADLERVAGDGKLRLEAWLALPPARARNALRAWFQQQAGQPLPAALLVRLLAEWPQGGAKSWPGPGGRLRGYRGRLAWEVDEVGVGDTPVEGPEVSLHVTGSGRYVLPGWGGVLHVRRARPGEAGVALELLSTLHVQRRSGRERFQLGPGRPPRSLKKQFQELGVPAWRRGGPLIYAGDALVFVPGLGLDARCVSGFEGPVFVLEWWSQGLRALECE